MNKLVLLGTVLIVSIFALYNLSLGNNQKWVVSQPSPTATVQSSPTFGQRIKTSGCISVNGLPDKACTPGDIDPKVTQSNIQQTICVSGYTKTVRPPVSYTAPLKLKIMQEYGDTDSPKNYELDHLISLELGGNPTSETNLWPESYNIALNAREKDKVENYLHNQVCSGKSTLYQAQLQIANDWVSVYHKIQY
ncbi:MAG: hypothetical protein Q7R49_06230 [Candidatus Daviesbacteria bacterium]|nr:hypothetical protein [Candidatus Daviesbacteria bacterium]